MTREELLAQARRHMWAAWALSSEELASQAAETLIGLGMLVPEGGAQELVRLRARVAELEAAQPCASRPLPPRDALCARANCSHTGEEHHHAEAKCWARLPKRHGDPVTVCSCSGFMTGPSTAESADRWTQFFAPTQALRLESGGVE